MKILFVCLGNICRSPTAEGVLRQLAATEAPELQIEVDSAGTADYHVGAPPDSRSQKAALHRQVDLGGLRARQLCRADFVRFDLILAMDSANLRDIEAMRPPQARARSQLFMDFAPECALAEVPDPYYGDSSAFERVLDLSVAASRGLIRSLRRTPRDEQVRA